MATFETNCTTWRQDDLKRYYQALFNLADKLYPEKDFEEMTAAEWSSVADCLNAVTNLQSGDYLDVALITFKEWLDHNFSKPSLKEDDIEYFKF
jgi:hypothetical protein